MAMIKPIALNVNAFDATEDHTFYFTSSGGDQVIKNEIKIIDNDTDETVYTNIVETYRFEQTVPKNTLENGKQYSVAFRTYGVASIVEDPSAFSDYVVFECHTKPIVEINIQEGQIIGSGSYEVTLTYEQEEDELLDYAYIELFNATTQALIERSPNLYNSDTPPLTIPYMIQGLLDENNYKIKATIITVNQTVVSTDEIRFSVSYEKPQLFSSIVAKPHNCEGYIEIVTDFLAVGGITHPETPIYIDNEKIDCRGANHNILDTKTSYNVLWEQGFKIENDFLLRLWFIPACINGNILRLYSSISDEYINLEYQRGVDKDYIILTTNSGSYFAKEINHISNGTVSDVSSLQEYFASIKIEDGNISFEELYSPTKEQTIFEWNNTNDNLSWNVTTDLTWVDSPNYEGYIAQEDQSIELSTNVFDRVLLGNGLFEHINITKDISDPTDTDIPSWDFNTIFDCNFANNVDGGNLDVTLSQLTSVRLKRRDLTNPNWITLIEKKINGKADININYYDSAVPNNIEQEYAFVPILNGGIEGDYILKKVTPNWNGVFISDGEKIFKMYNAVVYDNTTQNIQIGTLQPIGSKYPYIIQNSETNYKSGSISCQLCGYNFETTNKIDRADVVAQTNDFLQFMSNGKVKSFIDWNGNDIILKTINVPSVSYNSYYGNGIVNVAFSWVEQARYNNEEELKNIGFI